MRTLRSRWHKNANCCRHRNHRNLRLQIQHADQKPMAIFLMEESNFNGRVSIRFELERRLQNTLEQELKYPRIDGIRARLKRRSYPHRFSLAKGVDNNSRIASRVQRRRIAPYLCEARVERGARFRVHKWQRHSCQHGGSGLGLRLHHRATEPQVLLRPDGLEQLFIGNGKVGRPFSRLTLVAHTEHVGKKESFLALAPERSWRRHRSRRDCRRCGQTRERYPPVQRSSRARWEE